jgi:two-component system, NtrC family, sensor kinase
MAADIKKTKGEEKILLVEDDHLVMKYLVKQLTKHGFSILQAENGKIGWDLFLLESPILIITDIYMPVLNGFELLKRVTHTSPEIPVVVISGVGTMEDVISAIRLGAWDFLIKPFEDSKILHHTIEKAVEWVHLKKISKDYQKEMEAKVLEKTNKIRMELQARKAAEKKIIQAKREWEQTFDAIPDLIALVNNQGEIFRVNKAMATALGIGLKEAVGKDFPSLFFHEPLPDHPQNFQQLSEQNIEIFNERLGGHFEFSIIPYSDPDTDKPVGSIYVARNINERKKAELEKEEMHSQLLQAQKLESVGQLAAGIAHEINTPIQYISTNIDFLDEAFSGIRQAIVNFENLANKAAENTALSPLLEESRQILDEADWEYLKEEIPSSIEQSRSGLKRVSSIVRAMKEFSHPGSKEKEMVDLAHIIETTVIVARNEWKYVAEVVTDFDKDLSLISCLTEEIGQVILNLLINAAHAIGEKLGENPAGRKGMITIKTKASEDWAEISVTDTGTGVPEAIRNRIFDPFFTTKKVGRGTGQGLAIVHDVITVKHQGTINIETKWGQGTTFIIRLPLSGKKKNMTPVN